jgi:hypothetical protein
MGAGDAETEANDVQGGDKTSHGNAGGLLSVAA